MANGYCKRIQAGEKDQECAMYYKIQVNSNWYSFINAYIWEAISRYISTLLTPSTIFIKSLLCQSLPLSISFIRIYVLNFSTLDSEKRAVRLLLDRVLIKSHDLYIQYVINCIIHYLFLLILTRLFFLLQALRSLRRSLQSVVEDVTLSWNLPPEMFAPVLAPEQTSIFRGQKIIIYSLFIGKIPVSPQS